MNIKEELINVIDRHGYSIDDISWVWLSVDNSDNIFNDNTEGHYYEFDKEDNDDINDFINSLDINYDDGYGRQYVDGVVMMNDNTWFERKEYDGSEWWAKCCIPVSPKQQRLNRKK